VLIVAGALDVPAVVALSRTLEKRISGAKRVMVPDTAHVVTMEAPQLFEQLALEFIFANETAEKV
jgi:pimeloyl-ACP methyl ester carboxylesterase